MGLGQQADFWGELMTNGLRELINNADVLHVITITGTTVDISRCSWAVLQWLKRPQHPSMFNTQHINTHNRGYTACTHHVYLLSISKCQVSNNTLKASYNSHFSTSPRDGKSPIPSFVNHHTEKPDFLNKKCTAVGLNDGKGQIGLFKTTTWATKLEKALDCENVI